MDVRLTSDGVLVVLHDPTVDRTTDGAGPVAGMTFEALRRLNAGHDFRGPGGGFPYRDAPVRIPTFSEVLAAHPDAAFIVEMKTPDTAGPLCDAITEAGRRQRTLVGAFAQEGLDRFRAACPESPTSASFREAIFFLVLARLGLGGLFETGGPVGPDGTRPAPGGPDALLVSETNGPITVLTPGFERAAARRGLPVVVWTVNEPADMRRLLARDIHGILTDDPAALERVLAESGR